MWSARLKSALFSLSIIFGWLRAQAGIDDSPLAIAGIGDSLKGAQILGNPVWRYLFFLGVVILAMICMKLIDYLLSRKARKWASRKDSEVYSAAVDVVRKPIRMVITIAAIWLALSLFDVPASYQKLVDNLMLVLTAILVTFVLLKLVDLLIAVIKPRVQATESKLDDQLLPIVAKAL